MNLILFERGEIAVALPRGDRRAIHLLDVLRRQKGETFDAGLVNGPKGKGTVVAISESTISLSFCWGEQPPPSDPVTMIVGLPRPQTGRALLRDLTSMGVAAIHFVTTERGDPNYASSSLWSSGEWRRHLLTGAEQAFCTHLPKVTFDLSLAAALTASNASGSARIALDIYESTLPLYEFRSSAPYVTLAVGPERGWSAGERDLLRDERYTLTNLGRRVLRTETACVSALTLIKAERRWL